MFLPVFKCSKERFPIFPHVHFTFLVLWLLVYVSLTESRFGICFLVSILLCQIGVFFVQSLENFHISTALSEILAFDMRIEPSAKKGLCN